MWLPEARGIGIGRKGKFSVPTAFGIETRLMHVASRTTTSGLAWLAHERTSGGWDGGWGGGRVQDKDDQKGSMVGRNVVVVSWEGGWWG